jgi:hypothetical protein
MKRVLLVLVGLFLTGFGAIAQTTNALSDAEIKGRQLAREILEQIPTKSFDQKGILRIEPSVETITYTPFSLTIMVTNDYWQVEYFAEPTNKSGAYVYDAFEELHIIHEEGQTNRYLFSHDDGYRTANEVPLSEMYTYRGLSPSETMSPFAGSDFWICDLGLEFFHWPGQKVLKHETRRTRECTVLESINPNPSSGGYSRVVSWIDDETLGPVHAEAYDANGKLLKEFDPKSFKKVNGQWELQDMEIRNVQTKSRTWIKFDLTGKS